MFPFAGSDIALIGVVIVVILFLFAGIKTVPQGYHWTVERFGRYTRTLDPGLKLIVPFIDRIGHKMNDAWSRCSTFPARRSSPRTTPRSRSMASLFYQVLDAARASYEVHEPRPSPSLNLAMTNIRTVMGSMDLDALLSNRDDDQRDACLRVVDQAASPWGVKVLPHRDQGHRAPRAISSPPWAGR